MDKLELPEQWADITDGQLTFTHEYPKPGKYKAMFTLHNIVSTLTLKSEAFLLRRIDGLMVETGLKGRPVPDGYGLNKDRYPVNKVIQFKTSVAGGDVEKYIVELNGEQFKSTTNPTIKYSSTEVCAQTIS